MVLYHSENTDLVHSSESRSRETCSSLLEITDSSRNSLMFKKILFILFPSLPFVSIRARQTRYVHHTVTGGQTAVLAGHYDYFDRSPTVSPLSSSLR